MSFFYCFDIYTKHSGTVQYPPPRRDKIKGHGLLARVPTILTLFYIALAGRALLLLAPKSNTKRADALCFFCTGSAAALLILLTAAAGTRVIYTDLFLAVAYCSALFTAVAITC